MPLRTLLSPLLILLTFGSIGCRSGSSVAREDFAKKHSCPDDRVTVTKRSDITWDSLLPKESETKPPKAIAEDPARLAKWASDQAKSKPQTDHCDMFEVSGCDVRE